MKRAARAQVKRATDWPRYLKAKPLRGKGNSGKVGYYWEPRDRDREAGFSLPSEALGTDYGAARDRATLLNAYLDDWRAGRGAPKSIDAGERVGTVDWWFEHYFRTEAFKRLSVRTQADYRDVLDRLADLETKLVDAATGQPRRFGQLPTNSITPAAVDKLYARMRERGATRQANYAIDIARRSWNVVSRTYPEHFLIINPADRKSRVVINPWVGVVKTHTRNTTRPCTRDEAFALADAIAALGHVHLAIVPIVCFELLQRPENIIGGHLAWPHYRPADRPDEIEIVHAKTGKRIWHRLEWEDVAEDGSVLSRRLYPELEERLAALPRLGVAMVVLQPQRGSRSGDGERPARLYQLRHAKAVMQKAREKAGLPHHVTFAACRHGGMTLLGDALLPESAIMALSGHVTPAAARLYVKRTETQRLAGAIQRRDFIEAATSVRERKVVKSGNGA